MLWFVFFFCSPFLLTKSQQHHNRPLRLLDFEQDRVIRSVDKQTAPTTAAPIAIPEVAAYDLCRETL